MSETSIIFSSLLLGLSVCWLSHSLLSMIGREIDSTARPWEFEQQRHTKLRDHSRTYLWFEPLIDELKSGVLGRFERSDELDAALPLVSAEVPWQSSEFIVVRRLEALLAGFLALVLGTTQGGIVVGVFAAGVLAFFYQRITVNKVIEEAAAWRQRLLGRLPFTIDLMALMMEAGATFGEALGTVVARGGDHPLDGELANLKQQLDLGRTRREALVAFAQRLDSEAVTEIATAIIKGEELGSPLHKVLRSQSDELLLKRSQWAEKAAADAQVKIVFPGMLVMIACLIVVLAPFLLPLLEQEMF